MTTTATAAAAHPDSTRPQVIDLEGLKAVPMVLVDPGTNRRGPVGDVTGLAKSILDFGQLEAATLVPAADGRFEVFEGGRRYAALRQLGAEYILAVVRDISPADVGLRQVAIHTNRKEWDPIAEATVVHDAMFGKTPVSREKVAALLGRSPDWVKGRASLYWLPERDKDKVRDGRWTVTHALSVLHDRRNPVKTARPRKTAKKALPASLAPRPRPADSTGCPGVCDRCGAGCAA